MCCVVQAHNAQVQAHTLSMQAQSLQVPLVMPLSAAATACANCERARHGCQHRMS